MNIYSISLGRAFATVVALMVFAASTSYASQVASPHTQAWRYNVAGQLTGTISADPDGDGPLGYLATRYIYVTGKPNLVAQQVHGYLSAWQDETVDPSSWPGFGGQTGSSYGANVYSVTRYTYNAEGFKQTEGKTDRDGNYVSLIQYSYDSRGRVKCSAVRMNQDALHPSYLPVDNTSDPLSGGACILDTEGDHGADRITMYVYDEYNNVLERWKAYGTSLEQREVAYTYNNDLQIETITDANGNVAEYDYDDQRRLEYWWFPTERPFGGVSAYDYEQYGYDNNNNRTSLRKRDDYTISYSYDNLNRVIKKTVPSKSDIPASAERDIFYHYDLTGNLLHARFDSDSGYGVINSYNGFGELTSELTTASGSSFNVSHTYDSHGNRETTTYPDAQTFSYHHDGLDRLENIREPGSSANLIHFDYDSYGRPTSSTALNGTSSVIGYNAASRVETLNVTVSPSLPADNAAYYFGYNAAGQVIAKTLDNSLYHHLDGLGQTGSYRVNGLNQYTEVNGREFSYDDANDRSAGNLTSDGINNYVYDVENRLLSVSSTVNANATLEYDPLGRLFKYSVSGGETVRFAYAGDNIIAEYQGSSGSTLLRRYLHAGSMGTPLVSYSGSTVGSNRTFIHTDHQGSVIATSNNSGVMASLNTYDAFGVSGDLNEGRFGYTGQVWLPEVGLYYYRARVYDPDIGRFLQTDPIGYEDQMNLYAYVHNDPMNLVDPMGMQSQDQSGFAYFSSGFEELGQAIDRQVTRLKEVWKEGMIMGATGGPGLGAIRRAGAAAAAGKVASRLTKVNPRNLVPTQLKSEMSGSQIKRLAKDMKANGFDQNHPVDVVETASGRMHIEDGHHRVEAAKRAGIDEIPANVHEATKSSNSDNGMSGSVVKICSGMGAQKGGC